MGFWACFQRCNLILDGYKLILNMDVESNYLDEYLTLKQLHLKTKS